MEEIASELLEELNCETAFTIPILGGIPIAESVVITWVIMAFMVILSICLTRNFKVEKPGRRQIAVEYCVTALQNMVKGIIGEEGKRYVPYLVTVIVYIGIANIDEHRAKEALERAQEAIRQKQSIQEYHMSQANMARAMARLAVKKHYIKDK